MARPHLNRTQAAAFAERIGSTFLFTALGVIVVYLMPLADGHHGLGDIAWLKMLSAAAVAGLLSTIKCIVAALSDGNPGIGSFETVATPGAQAKPAGAPPVEVVPDPDTTTKEGA